MLAAAFGWPPWIVSELTQSQLAFYTGIAESSVQMRMISGMGMLSPMGAGSGRSSGNSYSPTQGEFEKAARAALDKNDGQPVNVRAVIDECLGHG